MTHGDLLTEFEFGAGARLALYTNRVVLHGPEAMESVPLAHLASVRVAFERDRSKLIWAVVLLVVALILALVSRPLQDWMFEMAGKVATGGGRESLETALHSIFTALGQLARLMFPFAMLLAAGAVALLMFFWLGLTTLTLSFAASERAYPVRGRNPQLVQFAEAVAEQLSVPRGGAGT